MKRVGYGQSHKLKGSMRMGLAYPVLCEEMIPGDIRRVKPEVFIQSVIPPTVQLTDNIKYKIEFAFVPNRLVDDTFVRNITTTKDGTVKGNFKTWSLSQIEDSYGSVLKGKVPKRTVNNVCYSLIPQNFKEYDYTSLGVAKHSGTYGDDIGCKSQSFKNSTTGLRVDEYNEVFPYALQKADVENGKMRCSSLFGQGSIFDWLGLEPNANIGLGGDFVFNTWALSSYYMICNFWHTKPEYEKYIAPYFDYVYSGRDNSENRSTLHRYETLEEEFGNTFEEPRLSGRCVNGLFIDNWTDDYFSNTMKTPQRGIAPVVPVSLTGYSLVKGIGQDGELNKESALQTWDDSPAGDSNYAFMSDGLSHMPSAFGVVAPDSLGDIDSRLEGLGFSPMKGGFVISDLRSALALQHFQEDTQNCFKWSDWLQKVYGIAPSDNTLDEPEFIGACSGYLSSDAVVSTSSTSGAELGEIGGKLGVFDNSNKVFTYMAKEHGTLMAIMTIKPERNYESGVDKKFMRRNYLDMYFKYLTGIGNQAISVQEVCAVIGDSDRNKNWGFTSRFEEFRHSRNRIVGKCRNNNVILTGLGLDLNGNPTVVSHDSMIGYRSDTTTNWLVPYLNTFHPYAIGDAYYSGKQDYADLGLRYNENNQNFLLCIPQLNDIFVDDTEEPFMVVLGFNQDVLSPIPAFTQAGVQYV